MNSGTKKLKLCFGSDCSFLPGLDSSVCEEQYQTIYKPLISSLYAQPELFFTLYLSGTLIDWMEQHHEEFFMILEELVSRKQIEILGGGYYSPLFPLIPPADRVGQTELLTTVLRKYFGKRPRGAWLTASAWEPSLISSFCTCGIEYVMLDKILLETSGYPGVDGLTPVTVEDAGKTLTAIPVDNRFRFLDRFSPASFFDELCSYRESEEERLLVVFLEPSALKKLFASFDQSGSWFNTFLAVIRNPEAGIELSTPTRLLKNRTLYPRAYISPGMSPFEFADIPVSDDLRILSRTSAKHFLISSPEIMNIYAKMMYVHILVNQLRGDKSRKKTAREELWRAQNSSSFRCPPEESDCISSRSIRALAYRNLLITEKATRLRGVFSPSIITFDFDMDGCKEYLCQLESLNMYVHASGGKIFEFDVLNSNRNYCDLSFPSGGLFLDHFIDASDMDKIRSGEIATAHPVFSGSLYQEVSVDPSRHDIQLKTSGLYGTFQQPVSLRKQYSFRNEGIQVQYILKNDSPLNLSGIFLIELDLSLPEIRQKEQIVTVYAHEIRQECHIETGHFDDVSWLQIDDPENGVKFTLDANENPSVSVFPVLAARSSSGKHNPNAGIRIFQYWKVDLGPNYEMEKMVFLKIDT